MPEDNQPTGANPPKKIFVNDFSGSPSPPTTPAAAQPVESVPAVAPEPVPVAPPPQPTAEPSQPTVEPAQAGPSSVPKFGELQPKVEAHPLFSGAAEPAAKKPRRWLKRTIAPVVALLVAAILLYLVVDAGLVKGYSHLPFHFFKAPVATSVPTITPATPQTTSGYQTIASKFISAMQTKDKTTANNLESDSFKAQLTKTTGSASFYDYCQKAGVLCAYYFDKTFLGSATETTQTYKSSAGTTGEEIKYSANTSSHGNTVTQHLTLDVIPQGNSWLIDNLDLGSNETNVNLTPAH